MAKRIRWIAVAIAVVAEASRAQSYVPVAQTLDRAAETLGIDYIAGFSALVHKGTTPGDAVLLASIPEALTVTNRVCSSINVASTPATWSTERPVGNRAPQTEPSASRKSMRIGAAVPGAPSIRAAPA